MSDPDPETATNDAGGDHPDLDTIVNWSRTAGRLRISLLVIGTSAVTAWLVVGYLRGGPEPRLLAEFIGIGLLVAFGVEVVVVGGAAIRGMFAAGARGDRLAGEDVTLLPPQLVRRRRRTDDHDGS